MSRTIDLNPNHFATVERILAEHVPGCEVRAYGSRATWTAKDYSDLDLAVVGEAPSHWRTLSRLKEAFEESRLPMRVDVLDWHTISESFRDEIERDFVVVQEAGDRQAGGEWREMLLGELTDNFDAARVPVKQADRRPGPYPYYGASGVVDYIDDFLFDGEYLLIAEDGENLRTRTTPIAFLANGKFWVNNHAHIVRGNSNTTTLYLKYALSELDISGYLTGSTMPKLTQGNMNSIPLLIPPLPEQRAIAHILGTLDDKIELNRRMNETLEEMARALFKSWFVDFDPVRAKMEGRWRRGESLPGLPAEHYDLFPGRLVPSELGEIPEGWEVKELGDICHKPQYGYTASAKDEHVGPKFLRITDINKNAWIEWEQVPYCEITDEKCSKYRLSQGDILIARMADPGHGCMIEEVRDAVFASYLIRFRPVHVRYSRLLQYWLRSDAYWELVAGRGAGTTRVSLNARVLSGFPLVIPTRALMDDFRRRIDCLRARIVSNTIQSRTLVAQRDAMLPKLMSGEVGV